MKLASNFLAKNENKVVLLLLLVACLFLSFHIFVPLTDYDEATYAKVVIDTMKSGDITTLSIANKPFFEKPPLYFWLAMVSVKVLGNQEVSFRLPAILCALFCLCLVYKIVKELTGDTLSSSLAMLVFLFSPLFYYFAKEARLDQGVLVGILGAFYFWVKGWDKEKYLLGVFPLLAIAVLFKSVIAGLFVPIVLIYCVFNKKWSWLSGKYLWWGFLLSLVIVLPWHVLETVRYGKSFWQVYFYEQLFGRSISKVTGSSNDYLDYLKVFMDFGYVWSLYLLAIVTGYVTLFFSSKWHGKISLRCVSAPLCVATVIIVLFSFARTHLVPYIMPALPFVAIFVGVLYSQTSRVFTKRSYLLLLAFLPLIFLGIYYFFTPAFEVPYQNVVEEWNIGNMYKKESGGGAPLYSFGGPYHETVNYYGDTKIIYIDPGTFSGTIKGPFYAMANKLDLEAFFYLDSGGYLQGRNGQKLLYSGDESVLIYFPNSFSVR